MRRPRRESTLIAVPASASRTHNLASLLTQSARRFPKLPAVAVGTTALHDYAGLADRVARLASAFAAAGLASGDRVVLVSRNCAEYIEVMYACWHAGLCVVPVNSKLHPNELMYVLGHAGARWAFVDDAWESALVGRTNETPALERLIVLASTGYARLFASVPHPEPA